MFATIIIGVGLIFAFLHIIIDKKARDKKRIVEILLLYSLVFGVGLNGLLGFFGHVFMANEVAIKIGWPTGSPFQFEVGMHDGAWGVLAILCIWARGSFWLATGIGYSIFSLGAAYGHIKQAIISSDFAAYNIGTIFPDIFIPVLILGLLIAQAIMNKRSK